MHSLWSAAVQYTNYGTGGAFELPTQSGTHTHTHIYIYKCLTVVIVIVFLATCVHDNCFINASLNSLDFVIYRSHLLVTVQLLLQGTNFCEAIT